MNHLFHDCLHPHRVHQCSCGLRSDHSDTEWDDWYHRREAERSESNMNDGGNNV